MSVDIPTALTTKERFALQAIVRDKHVLEIGALLGYSTVIMAQNAKRVVSLDPHEGYPEGAPRPTWERYLANLDMYGVREKVIPVQATWQAAVGTLPSDCLYPYEVVFIDLTGKYEDTKEALMYFHPEWGWSLKTIAVHDCGHPDWPGVDQAVAEFREFIGIHATFEQVDRLGIFRYV
jgi:methyltransferase family protein